MAVQISVSKKVINNNVNKCLKLIKFKGASLYVLLYKEKLCCHVTATLLREKVICCQRANQETLKIHNRFLPSIVRLANSAYLTSNIGKFFIQ